MRKISLVIFDCDGVLVDSEYLSAQVLVETFAEIGVAIDLPFVFEHFLGHSFSSVAAKFAKLHGIGVRESFETDYRANLLRRFGADLKPMPGVMDVLDRLAVPFCVATGSSPLRVSRSLEVTDLAKKVNGNVFTAAMVTHGKPAPDIFLHAAAAMGVPPGSALQLKTAPVELRRQVRREWSFGNLPAAATFNTAITIRAQNIWWIGFLIVWIDFSMQHPSCG